MFETNSSSVHALIICNDSELKKFKEGQLFLRRVDTSRIWHDEPTLITLNAAYRLYKEEREERQSLPRLTKQAFRELLLDPPKTCDYEYQSNDVSWQNKSYVNWNFSKKKYSKSTLKQLENYHEAELAGVFSSIEFPKSYTYIKELADAKDSSEKKTNVLQFTVWD